MTLTQFYSLSQSEQEFWLAEDYQRQTRLQKLVDGLRDNKHSEQSALMMAILKLWE